VKKKLDDIFAEEDEEILALAISENNDYLVYSLQNTIKVYNFSDKKLLFEF